MATAETTNPTAMRAPVARAAARPSIQVAAPSRREFLYYIWGASMALLLGQTSAGLIWFAFPRFKEGEFGGTFAFNPEELPGAGAAPVTIPSGRFHITHTPDGMRALYQVCTHLGCLPKWVPTNFRFECPCHGFEVPVERRMDRGAGATPSGSLHRHRNLCRWRNGRNAARRGPHSAGSRAGDHQHTD